MAAVGALPLTVPEWRSRLFSFADSAQPSADAATAAPSTLATSAAEDRHQVLLRAVEEMHRAAPRLAVELDAAQRAAHARDVSFHTPRDPDAVVYATSAEEVAAVLRTATRYRIPVTPYAAATSLEGHVVPRHGGISLDLSRMDRVLAVRPEDMDCDVEPGVGWEALNDALRPHHLFFSPDPGPGACIGGMIGTSCSGMNAARYGTIKENILSLEVVLPTGEIVRKTRSRVRKSSAGYDLTHLFIGSEGTLGVVTKATLRLRPIAPFTGVAACTFDRVEDAAAAVQEVVGPVAQVPVGRCEMMDALAVRAVNLSTDGELALDERRPLLLLEMTGDGLDAVQRQADRVRDCAARHGLQQWRFAAAPTHAPTDPADADAASLPAEQHQLLQQREELWRARKVAYWSAFSLRPGAECWITDVAVPLSQLSAVLRDTEADIRHTNEWYAKRDPSLSPLLAPLLAHAADGNFHLLMLIHPDNPHEMERAAEINHRLVMRAIRVGGTCTGEHGIGEGKRAYLAEELGTEGVALMRRLKALLDPAGIMNPGKVLPDDA